MLYVTVSKRCISILKVFETFTGMEWCVEIKMVFKLHFFFWFKNSDNTFVLILQYKIPSVFSFF